MRTTDTQHTGLDQVSRDLRELPEVAALAREVYANSIVRLTGGSDAPNFKSLAYKVVTKEQISQIGSDLVQSFLMSPSCIPEAWKRMAAGIAQMASQLVKAADKDAIIKAISLQLAEPHSKILHPLIEVTRPIRFRSSDYLEAFRTHFRSADNFRCQYRCAIAEMERLFVNGQEPLISPIITAFQHICPGSNGRLRALFAIENMKKGRFFQLISSNTNLQGDDTIIQVVANGLYSPQTAEPQIDTSICETLKQRLGDTDSTLIAKLAQCSFHFSVTVPHFFLQDDGKHVDTLDPRLLPLIDALPRHFVRTIDKFLNPQESLNGTEIDFLKGSLLLSQKRSESLGLTVLTEAHLGGSENQIRSLREVIANAKLFEDLLRGIIRKLRS
jgi:hypothetical protein